MHHLCDVRLLNNNSWIFFSKFRVIDCQASKTTKIKVVVINLQVEDHDLDYVVAKPKVFAQFLVTDCPCGAPVE